jgi:hypothetical protein
MKSFAKTCVALSLNFALSSCGLYVPEKDLFKENIVDDNGKSTQGNIESNIIANIRCELTKGLYKAVAEGHSPWLTTWGTTIALNLTWDETSSFNTGANYTKLTGTTNNFSLGAGLSASAKSTRAENITFTLENITLLKEAGLTAKNPGLDCSAIEHGVTVRSNLKIDEFVYDKATIVADREARTRPAVYSPFSVFQETITFVITQSGGITPGLKLTRLTFNPTAPFLGATRVKTSQIILTLGPLQAAPSAAGVVELSEQARIQHEAAVIGAATAASIISQTQ